MSRTTEIRNIQPGVLFKLCNILDNNGWKDAMAIVPLNPLNFSSPSKYTVEQMQLIAAHGKAMNKSCTEIFIQEWGTSGKVRPTLQTLLEVLVKAQLFRAADYIAVDVLGEPPPQRPLDGPAAKISFTLEELPIPEIMPPVVEAPNDLPHYPFSVLCQITDNFDNVPYSDVGGVTVGHKLGAGAFGSVYRGILPDGTTVAVKKLLDDSGCLFQQFQTEITTLSSYKHPNLLPLLGFSCDTPEYCIVYSFMSNGSLLEKLNTFKPNYSLISLNWKTRVEIAVGLCRAIHYLHTAQRVPLIHRDIKSANILLDEHLTARLGDFGLVKMSPSDSRMTSTVFGTSAYMAPEAFRGDVSVKMDVFSAGVVFLELLTALPPYDEAREGADIVTFIEETIDEAINPLLDSSAFWDERVANDLFKISQRCLEDKKRRPIIGEVLDCLTNLMENISFA